MILRKVMEYTNKLFCEVPFSVPAWERVFCISMDIFLAEILQPYRTSRISSGFHNNSYYVSHSTKIFLLMFWTSAQRYSICTTEEFKTSVNMRVPLMLFYAHKWHIKPFPVLNLHNRQYMIYFLWILLGLRLAKRSLTTILYKPLSAYTDLQLSQQTC